MYSEGKLRCADWLLQAEVDGLTVVLDLRRDGYFVLDALASSLWRELVQRIAFAEEAPDKPELGIDCLPPSLLAFARDCFKRGWLETGNKPREPRSLVRAPSKPSALQAWYCLAATHYSLSVRGFPATYDSLVRNRAGVAVQDRRNPDEGLRAFARAENFFHLKSAPNDCVCRSLALFKFMHACGFAVEHCIGVRRFPFQAHAWVEHAGRVIHDNPHLYDRYTKLQAVLP